MAVFDDFLKTDHFAMLSADEFGTQCLNTRTGLTFNIIKTDSFVSVTSEGYPITEDKPMFNTSMHMINSLGAVIATDIIQNDTLTIEAQSFIVRDIRKDGIGGFDIYLKA